MNAQGASAVKDLRRSFVSTAHNEPLKVAFTAKLKAFPRELKQNKFIMRARTQQDVGGKPEQTEAEIISLLKFHEMRELKTNKREHCLKCQKEN